MMHVPRRLPIWATFVFCSLTLSIATLCQNDSHTQQPPVSRTATTPTKSTNKREAPSNTPSTQGKAKNTPVKPADKKDIATKDAVPAKIPPTKHIVTVFGSFADLVALHPANGSLKAQVVSGDLSISDDAEAALVNASTVKVTYSAAPNAPQPTTVYLGVTSANTPFPYLVAKSQDDLPIRRLVVSGDFCRAQPSPGGSLICGSHLLEHPEDSSASLSGYIYGADGSGYTPIIVHQLRSHSADIEYVADQSNHPSWIVFQSPASGSQVATFPYIQASPEVATDAVYISTELNCATEPLCTETPTIQSLSPDTAAKIDLLSVSGNIFFTRVTGRAGELPETITIQYANKKTFLARRVTLPNDDQALIAVRMNVMDQETVHRDFGADMAEHYVAVNLDVTNRTAKKLQFNKSAIWFDVDYSVVTGRNKRTPGQTVSTLTADLYPINPYLTTFSTSGECPAKKQNGKPAVFGPCKLRFGIEQNQRVSPINYSTVLNTFDTNVERRDRILTYVELLGSVLDTVATGGAVAQIHNTAFRDSSEIFTGNFLPGFRAITQDLAGTNRARANLVNDTFQEVVQMPANGHVSTIVVLPRDAIADVQGYEQTVVIERVLNVHIDPDVLNGVKDPPVPLNHVEVGYTKDQVRQSLGEPPNVSTAADGSAVYSYSTGPYTKVNFNKDGLVVSWDARTISDQISAAPTLEAVNVILKANALKATSLSLLNGNTVLTNISGLGKALQYDSSGKHIADYTLLYPAIKALIGKKRSDLETLIASKKLPSAATSYAPISTPSATEVVLTYAMPDVKDGTIVVTFSAAPVKTPSATIKTIVFQGTKEDGA